MTRNRTRPGFTLFELMIVIAIMVVALALAIPSLRVMQPGYKVQGAVDSVRAAWADARAAAAEQGRPYRFSVEPNGRFFRVAPDEDTFWPSGTGSSDDPAGRPRITEGS